jgi:3-deoxy-D-manno-octulosonic-acid transferase
VFYLPLDTRNNARAFVDLLQPSAAFVVKYEFWLNLLQALHNQHIPVVVAPAIFRSNQFFFKPWGRWMLQPLKRLHALMVQDETSLALLQSQGFGNASLCGDSRLDRVVEIAANPLPLPWLESFLNGRNTLVLGSTWPADEQVVLPALDALPDWAVVIVPHEIHSGHVQQLVKQLPGEVAVYSHGVPSNPNARFLVVDATGFLSSIYHYARIAYVGGGFTSGIHSILEPAAFGMPLLFGPDCGSFREANALIQLGAATVVTNSQELRQALVQSAQPAAYEQARNACRTWVQAQAGAKHRIAAGIGALLTD